MKEHGFAEFWAAWPSNRQGGYMRKGGKQKCLQAWIKGLYWTQAETIIRHVEWMKTTPDWLKDNGSFIPMPITYLNKQRWDGAEITMPKSQEIDPALAKIKQDDLFAAKPSAEIRAKLAQLRGLTH